MDYIDDATQKTQWLQEHPNGCYDCKDPYTVGGCPSCGEGGY